MKQKAQVAMEYLTLIGFILFVSVPLVYISYTKSQEINENIASTQLDKIGKKIIDAAESVFYLGAPSKTTIKVYMPDMINNITIANNELVFNVHTKNGDSDIVKYSEINITGHLNNAQGLRFISIQSLGNKVNITDD